MNEDVETLRTQLKMVANQRDEWERRYEEQVAVAAQARADAVAPVLALADEWEAWDEFARDNYGEGTHGREFARALRAAVASHQEGGA